MPDPVQTAESAAHETARLALAEALARSEAAAASHVLALAPEAGVWTGTGLDLKAGQWVSLLPHGVVWLSRALDLEIGAGGGLWYRVGDGPIAKSRGATTSFRAERDGPLLLTCGIAGQWADPGGALDPGYAPPPLEGRFTVAVLAWPDTAEAGLARLAPFDATGLAAAERRRLLAERPLPRGWAPLWQVGQTDIFCAAVAEDGEETIGCRCRQDAGILKHPLDIALDTSTRLSWSWRVEALPSAVAEDALPTHDYLSIAVEFENGRDLTYFWSAALPPETAFPCPIPGWTARETHVVVRSGTAGLGRWLDEERAVLADYRRAVGGPDPVRIVGVWLIALSPFQRGTGLCAYRRIRLAGEAGIVPVAPWASVS